MRKRSISHVLTHIADYPIHQINEPLPWNVTATLAPVEQKIAA